MKTMMFRIAHAAGNPADFEAAHRTDAEAFAGFAFADEESCVNLEDVLAGHWRGAQAVTNPLVVIVGESGSGKSALAKRLISRMHGDAEDEVLSLAFRSEDQVNRDLRILARNGKPYVWLDNVWKLSHLESPTLMFFATSEKLLDRAKGTSAVTEVKAPRIYLTVCGPLDLPADLQRRSSIIRLLGASAAAA